MDLGLPIDFEEFLKSLRAHKVEYLLIGGYAVAWHGYPRATADLDVWIRVSPENARRVVDALFEFGFESPELTPELFLKIPGIVRMGVPPVRIEILTEISGVKFDDCYSRRIVDRLGTTEVDIIGFEDLRLNKKASGRFKDLDDLENLP